MVRIAAAICTLVFGGLFAWAAVTTFTAPDPVIRPTDGVIASGARDPLPTGQGASEALAQRTRLQDWRERSGPSPGGKVTVDQALAGAKMANETKGNGAAEDSRALPGRWLAQREQDWPVLVDRGYLAGVASLPTARAGVLMQPQGREFRRRHESAIPYAGGWIVFGTSLALSLFLLLRGRIRLAEPPSGERIERFGALERANHWMTATAFVLLALTGLVLVYGWSLLQPLLGSDAYGALALASLYLHIAFAAPFLIGIGVMAVLWLRQNLPSRLDLQWLARFGGMLDNSGDNPPARRFNAGQKLVFWGVFLGGLLMVASGVTLMFPFFWTDVVALQWILLGHGLLALLMVALILGHIYIGTIGMERAFEAMWDGQVDRTWAEEHHRLWVEELDRGEQVRRARPAPAE